MQKILHNISSFYFQKFYNFYYHLYIYNHNFKEYNHRRKRRNYLFGDDILENLCEKCWYNTYDEDSEEYFCDLLLDEDEYVRLMQEKNKTCKYFRPDNGEYEIVRRQN